MTLCEPCVDVDDEVAKKKRIIESDNYRQVKAHRNEVWKIPLIQINIITIYGNRKGRGSATFGTYNW
jgi:hypothetical protein